MASNPDEMRTLQLTTDEALVLWFLGRELHKLVPESGTTEPGRDAVQSLSDKLISLFPSRDAASGSTKKG